VEGTDAPGLWSQSGSDRKRDAHALRQTEGRAGAKQALVIESRESREQRAVSCEKLVESRPRRAGGRASQRCGGMRGWAALSSHRTSDVPVSERIRDWQAYARWLQCWQSVAVVLEVQQRL
jgi:hypothetical protein